MWAGIDFGSKYAGTTAVCYGNHTNTKFVLPGKATRPTILSILVISLERV